MKPLATLGATLGVFALCAFAPIQASAAPLTLQQCVAVALKHDTTIASLQSTYATAENAYAQQKTQTYPTIVGQLQSYLQKSNNYGGAFAAIGASQLGDVSQNTASIGTQYNLNVGGQGFALLAQSRAQLENAKQNLQRAKAQLASTITASFYAVAQKDALVALDQSDLSYQTVLVNNAKAREKAGVAAGVDVLQAQVAQTKSKSTLLAAKADAQNARDTLSQAIGVAFTTEYAIPKAIATPALPKATLAKIIARAHMRPDVLAAKSSLAAAVYGKKAFDRHLFPTIALTSQIGNQFSPTSAVQNQNFLNQQCAAIPGCLKAPTVVRGSPGFWQIGATTTFSFPFLNYGAIHTEKVQDDAAIHSATLAYNSAASKAELDVRQAYRSAQTSLAQVAYAVSAAQLGSESAHIAQLQYERGVKSLTDVLSAQQTALSSQIDLVNARIAYVQAIINLRVAVGDTGPNAIVADLR
ncbi:MAG: TolC family protein [Vulcanimicrobiaceae bacterium]